MPDGARTPTRNSHSFSGTKVGITSDQDVRVTIETPVVGHWTMVLDSFIDHDLPAITELAVFKVMMVLFRKRDKFSNVASIKRPELISRTGLKSKGAVSAALKTLRDMRLIDDLGDDTYIVAPGIVFAGARGGSPQRTEVLNREPSFLTENRVSSDRTRAPEPPNQKKKRNEPEPDQGAEAQDLGDCAGTSGVGGAGRADSGARRRVPAGVATGDLFGLDRTVRLRAALEACGINEPARSVLMDIADLTAEEVLACSKQVMPDQSIENPAVVIAHRLLKRRGMTLPKAVKRANRFSDESFAVIRGLQLAQSRARGEAGGRA